MYGLPKETEITKPSFLLSKLADKLGFNSTDKQYLLDDVASMTITNVISPKTIPAIKDGKNVKAIQVIMTDVKRETYNRDVICKIANNVSGKAIFIIRYGVMSSVLINHDGKAIRSSWEPALELSLSGLTMDSVWENIVKAVGQIDVEKGLTLKQQIELNDLADRLQKQIDAIEKKARNERQPRTKFELAQKKKQLEEERIAKISAIKSEFLLSNNN